MSVKQLSVFLENREGRVETVFDLLSAANVNVVSVSLADTKDYGILRMLVNDNETAQKTLKENDISSKLVDVLAINIPHTVGSLARVLHAITDAGINIIYMYGLSTGDEGASIAFKTDDIPGTEKALEPLNVTYYTAEDLSSL
ncbi:MAG: ACT domain-containing protein [Clostridia bacterium]|nr:ACT domain-containing protein [Clostridia bacterium]